MDFMDIYTKLQIEAAQNIKHVARFILRPGVYINDSMDCDSTILFHRIVFYSLASTLLIFASMSTVGGFDNSENAFVIFGVTIMEVVSALVVAPLFYCVGRVGRLERPMRAAVMYVLTYKFIYLPIPYFAYALFLFTEDYTFCGLKGILLWAYIIGFALIFPLAIGRTLKMKAVLVATGIVAYFIMINGLSAISRPIQTYDSSMIKFTPFYDPIAAEIDRTLEIIGGESLYNDIESIMRTLPEALQDEVNSLKNNKEPSALKAFAATAQEKIAVIDSICTVQHDSINSLRPKVQFRTTKNLLDLRREELVLALFTIETLKSYTEEPYSGSVKPVLDAQETLLVAQNETVIFINRHYLVRKRLFSLMLSADTAD